MWVVIPKRYARTIRRVGHRMKVKQMMGRVRNDSGAVKK